MNHSAATLSRGTKSSAASPFAPSGRMSYAI